MDEQLNETIQWSLIKEWPPENLQPSDDHFIVTDKGINFQSIRVPVAGPKPPWSTHWTRGGRTIGEMADSWLKPVEAEVDREGMLQRVLDALLHTREGLVAEHGGWTYRVNFPRLEGAIFEIEQAIAAKEASV